MAQRPLLEWRIFGKQPIFRLKRLGCSSYSSCTRVAAAQRSGCVRTTCASRRPPLPRQPLRTGESWFEWQITAFIQDRQTAPAHPTRPPPPSPNPNTPGAFALGPRNRTAAHCGNHDAFAGQQLTSCVVPRPNTLYGSKF